MLFRSGKVLVNSPEVFVQSGKYVAAPLIIGDQEDEGTLISFLQMNLSDTASLVEYLSSVFYTGATKSEFYKSWLKHSTKSRLLLEALFAPVSPERYILGSSV